MPMPPPAPRNYHWAHPDCWCKPSEVEPGVWLHSHPTITLREMTRTIGWHHRGGNIDLHVEAYLAESDEEDA